MSEQGHRVLVVEDNPEERADVCAALELAGDSVRAAGTVEEALAALEEEEFCYYSFDQALPLNEKPGAKAFISGGERLTRAARALDKRHTVDGDDVTPIIALTSFSDRASFATDLFEMGISTFVSKPVSANMSYFLEKRRGVLARAGRGEHAKCAALAQRRADGAGAAEEGEVTSASPARKPKVPVAGGLAAAIGATKWSEIKITAVDGHTLRVQCGKVTVRRSYIDLGFGGASRDPIAKWKLVMAICAGHGSFRWKQFGDFKTAKNAVSVVQRMLKQAFGLPDNPIHRYRGGLAWQAKFFASSEIHEE